MGAYTQGFQFFNDYKLQNEHYYSLISVFDLKDYSAPVSDSEKTYPYWPINHVQTACREAGVNATDIEGGYGGDCLHLCNHENADHIYDPLDLDNNTNAYCIEGYDLYENFVASSAKYELDIC